MAWFTSHKYGALVAAAMFVAAEPARGCAVCGFGPDATSNTYLLSTALLSLIPLIAIGGVIYYVVRRVRAHDD